MLQVEREELSQIGCNEWQQDGGATQPAPERQAQWRQLDVYRAADDVIGCIAQHGQRQQQGRLALRGNSRHCHQPVSIQGRQQGARIALMAGYATDCDRGGVNIIRRLYLRDQP